MHKNNVHLFQLHFNVWLNVSASSTTIALLIEREKSGMFAWYADKDSLVQIV
jgi:hypothetical protein